MSETPHIYSPYNDMAYPKRHHNGCFLRIMLAAAIVVILMAIYATHYNDSFWF